MGDCIVRTKYGDYEGVYEDGVAAFKGIPYAQPPVGSLRFCAPAEPEHFSGVHKADSFGNRSMQNDSKDSKSFYNKEFYFDSSFAPPMSEDCLYLNIWTPEINSESKMPVLFYIHGGAFMSGYSNEIEFLTDKYAERNVILVTVNYRLGILGFLASEELKAEDKTACGNYGLLDQIAALRWVKENISGFGGDPDNITICGQSAGGMSVEYIMASRIADGLYDKAIIQSAGGYPQQMGENMTLDYAFNVSKKVFKYAGVSNIKELRDIDADTILKVQQKVLEEEIVTNQMFPYGPVDNGSFTEDTVTNLIKEGNMRRVPTIIGTTKDDIFITEEEKNAGLSNFHKSCISYSCINDEVQHNPSYVYCFRRELPGDDAGAFHSSELWYTFGSLSSSWRPFTEVDYELSNEMINRWTAFMKTGTPNYLNADIWMPCTKKQQYTHDFSWCRV